MFDQISWAMSDAPVADVEEFVILTKMAEKGDNDGCNCYQSIGNIARRAFVDPQTVKRRIKAMEMRGLIKRGDQRAVAHLPRDKRPVVYDLQIPYSWFGSSIDRINEYRAERGRGPLTAKERPDLAAAPEKKRRADAGVKRSKEDSGGSTSTVAEHEASIREDDTRGGSTSTPGLVDPPRVKSGGSSRAPAGGLLDQDGGSTSPTTLPLDPSASTPEQTGASLRSASRQGETATSVDDAPTIEDEATGPTQAQPTAEATNRQGQDTKILPGAPHGDQRTTADIGWDEECPEWLWSSMEQVILDDYIAGYRVKHGSHFIPDLGGKSKTLKRSYISKALKDRLTRRQILDALVMAEMLPRAGVVPTKPIWDLAQQAAVNGLSRSQFAEAYAGTTTRHWGTKPPGNVSTHNTTDPVHDERARMMGGAA